MSNQINQINLPGWQFEYNQGEWLSKAIPLVVPKKDHSKEKPQIKAVEGIEENYQRLFNQTLVDLTKNITKYLMK